MSKKTDAYKSKDQIEQSYIYQQLHQPPVCTATKTDSSGTPTSYLCKHVYVEEDASLWRKIEKYKTTQQDIDATTFLMINKTITWSDDKITRKYKPQEKKEYRGALDCIFRTGP